MMKRMIALLLACILTASVLGGCNPFALFRRPQSPVQPTEAAAVAVPETVPAAETAAPAATQAPTEPEKGAAIGGVGDYVRTAKEASFSYDDGTARTYRIPEIVLGTGDAAAANSEIMERFGDDVQEYTDFSPVISLDYEAYLNERYLSVITTGKYEGGNSYALCYTFDVVSGNSLNNSLLCSSTGRNYDTAVSKLTENLTAVYDERYGQIPGNDGERNRTLDSENIKAAKMYLNASGKLMAIVDLYAAVGGGHWVESIEAE